MSVFLLKLDVLHQVIENSFGLKTLFFRFTVLLLFKFEDALFRLERDLQL